jgi:hypothetical protein
MQHLGKACPLYDLESEISRQFARKSHDIAAMVARAAFAKRATISLWFRRTRLAKGVRNAREMDYRDKGAFVPFRLLRRRRV